MACTLLPGDPCVRGLSDEQMEFDTFACDGCEYEDIPPSPCRSCRIGSFCCTGCIEFDEWYRLRWS